jgi:putative drug exporter of the RND superfamily
MFGVGLTLAVVVDATVVRMVLLPAFMRLLGTWCWWAPPSLARLHRRFGISEGAVVTPQAQWRQQVSEAATVPASPVF